MNTLEELTVWKHECKENYEHQISLCRPDRRNNGNVKLPGDWWEQIYACREASNTYQLAVLEEYKIKQQLKEPNELIVARGLVDILPQNRLEQYLLEQSYFKAEAHDNFITQINRMDSLDGINEASETYLQAVEQHMYAVRENHQRLGFKPVRLVE